MPRIEDLKNQLAGAREALNAARENGIKMMDDATISNEEATRAYDAAMRAGQKVEMLEKALAEETEKQAKNLAKEQATDMDRVQNAAKAFKSAGDFFAAVSKRGDVRMAQYATVKASASGQNITTDAEGGYLVPPEYAAELLKSAESESVIFPDVAKVAISSNRLVENYVKQNSRKDTTTSVYGRNGVIAYWKAEAAQYDPTKITFGQLETPLNKLTGLCYATDEMLEDAVALSGIIGDAFADEFAFKIDDAIINGTGSNMPMGMLATGNTALVSISRGSDGITIDDIQKMYNALPANLRSAAKWYINQDVELDLMGLALSTANGTLPVYLPAGGISGKPYSTLMGMDVKPVEQCSAVGTKGDILLAVPSLYRWVDKGGMTGAVSMHVRFDYDEQAFKFTYRAGGRPMWVDAVEAYKGSTKRSPYIALA